MRRTRFMLALTMFVGALLTFAPAAFARADGGQGFYGETTDKGITLAMFGVVAFFPVLIATLSADPVAARQAQARSHGRGQGAGRPTPTGVAAGSPGVA